MEEERRIEYLSKSAVDSMLIHRSEYELATDTGVCSRSQLLRSNQKYKHHWSITR
jgi:hypothetical protein